VFPSDTSWLSEPTTGVHQFGGRSNLYSFEGLIKAATPFAKEKLAAKAEQHKKEEERVASKKAKLTLVPSA
jgi:hypothetical protein